MAAIFIHDNHAYQNRRRPMAPRLFKQRLGLEDVVDAEVHPNYRFDRQTVSEIIENCRPFLEKKTLKSSAIPVETQAETTKYFVPKVLGAEVTYAELTRGRTGQGQKRLASVQVLASLRFLAKGGFYSEIADNHGISRPSFSRIIFSVARTINTVYDNIKFPDNCQEIKLGFLRKCRIPGVVGAIDCTHIPIIAPKENEHVYVNRKGTHSINVQAVVDHEMRFTNVVARWPGSTHDAVIFDNCGLKQHLENKENSYLLGDGGYPLRRYLLTPFLNPVDDNEVLYNTMHSRGRVVVERSFGVLKSRFRCLHKTGTLLMCSPERTCQIVMCCMRLHNLALSKRMPEVEDDLNDQEEVENYQFDRVDNRANDIRRRIIENFQI